MRKCVDTLIVLAILAIGAQTWLVAGWLAPIVVASGSMAPRLLGPHRWEACPECGLRFACDALDPPILDRALCPNCWRQFDAGDARDERPGARLLVDRSAWDFASPGRWELAVLADPLAARNWVVKRVIGLPGETIDIRDGDVFVDGRRARKSLARLREMAILVHDDEHRPAASSAGNGRPVPGWWPDGAASAWRPSERGWTWRWPAGASPAEATQGEPSSAPDAFDWLTYHHVGSPAAHGGLPAAGPVTDDYAYNQAESRLLNPAFDLLVRFRATIAGDARLAIGIDDGRDTFEVRLLAGKGACALRRAGGSSSSQDPLAIASFAADALAGGGLIELAQVDGQILVAVDGQLLLDYPYEPADAHGPGPDCPVRIGLTQGRGARLGVLQLLRDVTYLPSATDSDAVQGPWRLAAGEYFLLGDNSPRSIDSRAWPPGAAPAGRLVGRAISVLWRPR